MAAPKGDFERLLDQGAEAGFNLMAGIVRFVMWMWAQTPSRWEPWQRFTLLAALWFGVPWFIGRGWPRLRRWWRGMPQVFGAARFATLAELRRAGMLEPGGRFLGRVRAGLLGLYRWHNLFMHGEGNSLTIAAQGAGKTTGLVIPTLITYRAGSVIVTDPSGEITAQTRRLRGQAGRVVVLNPWGEELTADPAFALDLGDDGFNPLQLVGTDPDGMSAASTLAGLLLPDMPGESPFWREEARALLEWGMLHLAAHEKPERRTLPELRARLFDTAALLDGMKAMVEDKAPPRDDVGAALRQTAARFHGMAEMKAGGQLSGVISTAATALKIYQNGTRLARHVSKGGFRLSDLKGGEPVTVFLICPPGHLVSDDRKWLNLVLALMIQQIGKPGRARETVLLIDEFPALGFLPNLLPSIEQFRKAGLRAHLIAQNVGQILQVYGQDGFRRLLGLEFMQLFRITDPETARLLSGWLGQNTVHTESQNARGEISVSLAGVPLIRPEELAGMRRDRQIIVRPEGRPVFAEVFPFFERPSWRAMVDPNPYRGS